MLCGQVVVTSCAVARLSPDCRASREPLRGHLGTGGCSAGRAPIVYCSDQRWTDLLSEEKLSKADAYALAQRKAGPMGTTRPPRRLSTVFRGWGRTRTEQTRATLGTPTPRSLAVHWHVRRSESHLPTVSSRRRGVARADPCRTHQLRPTWCWAERRQSCRSPRQPTWCSWQRARRVPFEPC